MFDVSILVLMLEFVYNNPHLSGQGARQRPGSILGGCQAHRLVPKENSHEAIVELECNPPTVVVARV